MKAQSARAALDASYLEARSKILDLAAILDRVDRGGGAAGDARLDLLRQGIEALLGDGADRAERVQKLFSLEYDPNWERPKPRY